MLPARFHARPKGFAQNLNCLFFPCQVSSRCMRPSSVPRPRLLRKYAVYHRHWLQALRKAPLPVEPMAAVPRWRRRNRADGQVVVPGDRLRVDALGANTGRTRPDMGAASLLTHAAAVEGVEVERLRCPRRDRATVGAREAVVVVALERYGLRSGELAAALARSVDQVSRWVGQASPRIRVRRRVLQARGDARCGRRHRLQPAMRPLLAVRRHRNVKHSGPGTEFVVLNWNYTELVPNGGPERRRLAVDGGAAWAACEGAPLAGCEVLGNESKRGRRGHTIQ